ncbi:MAG: hypothetical protein KKC01_10350 [Gammaproteobacteria bacterium]|nr:hypothetical protein [Gammaproteobacteria bacterium]
MNKIISIFMLLAIVSGTVSAQQFSKEAVEAAPSAGDLWVQNGKGGYAVEFVNGGEIAGFQFDLHDKSINADNYSCGAGMDAHFQVACTLHAEKGFLRVIVFSMDNAMVPDSTVVAINSNGGGSKYSARAAAPSLKGVIFSDNQGRNITSSHLGK